MAISKSGATDDKGKCWKAFSEFIRIKDCLETTGTVLAGICITCERKYVVRYLQAGHCFAGRTNAKLLMTKFVFGQCGYCNCTMHGERKKYEKKMRARYGDKFVDRAIYHMNKNIADRNIDWVGRTARYKRRTEKLLRQHGYKTYRELLEMTRD